MCIEVSGAHALVANTAATQAVGGRRALIIAARAHVHGRLAIRAGHTRIAGARPQRGLVVSTEIAEDSTALAAVATRDVLMLCANAKLHLAYRAFLHPFADDPLRRPWTQSHRYALGWGEAPHPSPATGGMRCRRKDADSITLHVRSPRVVR